MGLSLIDGTISFIGYFLAYGSLILIFLLSLPIVANRLLHSLEKIPPISSDSTLDYQVIVVIGAGKIDHAPEYAGSTVNSYTLVRVKYAAYLLRRKICPVLVSGGAPFGGTPEADLMAVVLREDFKVNNVWVESRSRNSLENAKYSAELLKKRGIKKIALISQPWHLHRTVKLFEAEGISVLPAPTGYVDRDKYIFGEFLPKSSALEKSALAIKEYIAGIFYF
jgi:uncharacterized SAM-binding protein YcdF (DUF218 family)